MSGSYVLAADTVQFDASMGKSGVYTVTVLAHGKTKKVLAENEMEGQVRATPVAANGILYVMAENKLYAIAEGAGKKK